MANVLNNVFKTAGLNGEQPWKQYYKGIKPVNPLGGNVVRRMGNKVKSVVSATNTKQMQFTYMTNLAKFSVDPNYVPPYKPRYGGDTIYTETPVESPPYRYEDDYSAYRPPSPFLYQEPLSEKELYRRRREEERAERERRREARRNVSDTRANYRTLLDTARETRNWSATLGIL